MHRFGLNAEMPRLRAAVIPSWNIHAPLVTYMQQWILRIQHKWQAELVKTVKTMADYAHLCFALSHSLRVWTFIYDEGWEFEGNVLQQFIQTRVLRTAHSRPKKLIKQQRNWLWALANLMIKNIVPNRVC